MYLRKLELKDAPLMLEWMQDSSVTNNLRTDFASMTINNAEEFINRSRVDKANLNFAIASDEDEYMGTVSLKNIENGVAEFAITVRSKAMGKGYSWYGMKNILLKAFNEYSINTVFWCVTRNNTRAIRFYDKHKFSEVTNVPRILLSRYDGIDNLKWYSVQKDRIVNIYESIVGCKVVRIQTIPAVNAGELSFFESTHDIPFEIKRFYYISRVPEGVRRGFHAHKNLKQLLFCPYGHIQIVLENINGREEIDLSDPSIGVIIDKCTWREMIWLKKDSVLCVAASDYYDVNDYIRDYDEFHKYIGV